jgi:F0F1-type ATP synthase assembly protein I
MTQPPAHEPLRRSQDPWAAVGRLSGGVLVYGGIGLLLDRWWDTSFMTPIGIVVGAALGIYTVYASLEQQ